MLTKLLKDDALKEVFYCHFRPTFGKRLTNPLSTSAKTLRVSRWPLPTYRPFLPPLGLLKVQSFKLLI